MATRKYRSEFSLNVFGNFALLVQPCDLEVLGTSQEFNGENPCHIYMICRRQRIAYGPAEFQLSKEEIAGMFRVQIGDQSSRFPFVMENSPDNPRIKIECPYPHTTAKFLDKAGREFHLKAADLVALNCAMLNDVLLDHLTLDVLYVGQSYGVEGARTAPQRLRNHSTLQQVCAEGIANSPDKEIWLLLWNFKSEWIASIDGRAKEVTASDREDDNHITQVLDRVVTDQLEIDLAEAALIRYFQPDYNKVYRNTFPSPSHSTYSDCYDLDLNCINVEVCTEDLGSRLKSVKVPAKWRHFAFYPLHSVEERQAMFDCPW